MTSFLVLGRHSVDGHLGSLYFLAFLSGCCFLFMCCLPSFCVLLYLSGAPTLSRLLEAGPTQFTTPLPSFTTVASEPPVKLVPPPVESVSQATIVMMPALPAPSSAPAVSTPESVAPGASLTLRPEQPLDQTLEKDGQDHDLPLDRSLCSP